MLPFEFTGCDNTQHLIAFHSIIRSQNEQLTISWQVFVHSHKMVFLLRFFFLSKYLPFSLLPVFLMKVKRTLRINLWICAHLKPNHGFFDPSKYVCAKSSLELDAIRTSYSTPFRRVPETKSLELACYQRISFVSIFVSQIFLMNTHNERTSIQRKHS